jgi:hypothetical protein
VKESISEPRVRTLCFWLPFGTASELFVCVMKKKVSDHKT